MNNFMNKKILQVTSLLLVAIGLGGCTAAQEAASAAASSPAGASLANVPKSTGEVVSNGSSSIGGQAATSGVILADLGSYTWTNKSRAFCQLSQMARDTIRNGAQADKIMCYIGKGVAAGMASAEGNIYDGNFHYFNFAGDMAGSGVKMKVRRNGPGGTIDLFQMYMCQSSVQSEYVSSTIDSSGNVTITAKHVGSGGGNTFSSSVTVTGAVNSSYQWTSKTITGANYSSWGAGGYTSTYGTGITLTQTATTMQILGYQRGSMSYTADSGSTYTMRDTFDMSFGSVIQLLNDSLLTTLALGDGSAKANMSFSRDLNADSDTSDSNEFNYAPGSGVVSWLGDTRADIADATTGDHYAAANALTLPSSSAPAAVSFSGSEVWDCSSVDNSQTFGTITPSSFATGITECDALFGGHDNNWIQCDMD